MRIKKVQPGANWILSIVSEDGLSSEFDVGPFLKYEAFQALRDPKEFRKILNGGYFIEWDCGADLSADTIEAQWHIQDRKKLVEDGTPVQRLGTVMSCSSCAPQLNAQPAPPMAQVPKPITVKSNSELPSFLVCILSFQFL